LQGHGVDVNGISAPVNFAVVPSYYRGDHHLVASAGAGVGLLWDAIHVDVVRGARWQTLLSIRHDFWDLL
jgi:hypothetical protein